MKKVKATNASLITNKIISELHRVANPGEIFEVTDTRYEFLSGHNPDNKVYVTLVDEQKKNTKKKKEEVKEELVENDEGSIS